MGEAEFRELVGGWAEILDMEPEARKKRLERLAHMIIEQKMAEGCPRTAVLVQRIYARKRDPVVQLAKGFAQLCEMDRARAERFGEDPKPAPPPLSPAQAAVAQAKTAAAMRGPVHPDDAAIWRQAGALRREMFSEQVLFATVPDAADIWQRPLELAEIDAIEAAQVAAFAAREAERAAAEASLAEPPQAEGKRGRQGDLHAAGSTPVSTDRPLPDEAYDQPEAAPADDDAFRAQAMAMFDVTFAEAPPEFRAVLEAFTPEQRLALLARCWPEGEEGLEVLRSPKAAQGP